MSLDRNIDYLFIIYLFTRHDSIGHNIGIYTQWQIAGDLAFADLLFLSSRKTV
jgi:hypothetical protein